MLNRCIAWIACGFALLGGAVLAEEKVDFRRDVLPILSNHCYTCHGPDSATREAGLRLDQRDSAIGEADSGEHAIAPGAPTSSELVRRVSAADADLRMPPEGSGKALNAKQIATLTQWIKQGAEYQTHWAFTAPEPTSPPKVADQSWPRNEIDQFVLARLEHNALKPAHEASRETLIRRVAFDLTGLPPSLAEVDAYLNDKTDNAYENMVDRYFDSPAYGEHMARHWLDLARYADTNGYQYDTERQQWVWRDWVINAYNQNQPFNEFTIEQLAGDLLPNATAQQRLATGFNRNHGVTIEGGIIDEEYRTEYVMDRLVTTGEVWMGLTVGCARCHEHKFDPISQREFYGMYAFFNQVPERGMRGFTPQEKIASPLAAQQQQTIQAELASLKAELSKPIAIAEPLAKWAASIAKSDRKGWEIVRPSGVHSTGGSKLTVLEDHSVLVGGANPAKEVYEITSRTELEAISAIRLETLTHSSLPGGGPGRHSNSNFVLSEFEVTATSLKDPTQSHPIKLVRAIADYSQANYGIANAIDGTTAGNNGWAVDGPTRKQKATAIFIAEKPFGFAGGTELRFRLRHEANFATHGIGRPRFALTTDSADAIKFTGIPADIQRIASQEPSQRNETDAAALQEYFLKHHDPRAPLRARIAKLEKRGLAAFPPTMIMQDMPKKRVTRLLNRGQYDQPTDEIQPNTPAVFPAMPGDAPKNRLGFARWLVDPQHPLTSRVAVNRYWQRLFGIGLVKTSEDFGVQGELPSHPELLDWLALEFVRSNWNVKQIQRLMITSATYRQTSHVGSAAYQQDPENRLLARGPRMRLDGEEIRDAALFHAGLLAKTIGGKSVYPYQPKGLWLELNNRPGYSKAYPQGDGEDLYRRSVYTFWKRTVPSPMLKTFDAPEREFCTIRRSRTNTPLQALLLLNGPQFVEAARHLGVRMIEQGGDNATSQITYAFRLVTSRKPSDVELAILLESHQQALSQYAKDPEAAQRLVQVGDSPHDSPIAVRELAAMTSIARMLLNLNEAITKG